MTREEAIVFMVQNQGRKVHCTDHLITYFYDNGALKYYQSTTGFSDFVLAMPIGDYEIVKQKVKKEIDVWLSKGFEKSLDNNSYFDVSPIEDSYSKIPAKLIVEVEK